MIKNCLMCGLKEGHLSWCPVPNEGADGKYSILYASKIAKLVLDGIDRNITRSMIVGSLGREEHKVGDIDILVTPASKHTYHIEAIRHKLKRMGEWSRGADRQMSVKNIFNTGISLDLFLQHPPSQWGCLVFYRLNPAPLVIWGKKVIENSGLIHEGGTVYTSQSKKPETVIDLPTEQSMFDLFGLEYCPPTARWDIVHKLGLEKDEVIKEEIERTKVQDTI